MLAPSGSHDLHAPISRTDRYKKITKPLLERQRRARINRCLDELKELMIGALQAEGENINKLEKADILELTVRHLHRLHQQGFADIPNKPVTDPVHRYQAGFSHCASEACHFLLSLPGLDPRISRRLVAHLGQCADSIQSPLRINPSITSPSSSSSAFSPPITPPHTQQRHLPPLPPQIPPMQAMPQDYSTHHMNAEILIQPGPTSAPHQQVIPEPQEHPVELVWRPWSH